MSKYNKQGSQSYLIFILLYVFYIELLIFIHFKSKYLIMKSKYFLIAIILLLSASVNISVAQNIPAGIFKSESDIGNPKKTGSSVFNPTDQSYILTGGGYNIWFERDEFHYLFNKMKGDFILTANFEFVGKGTDPHRKTGWMIRSSTDEKAIHITATLHGDGLTVLQWRVSEGAAMRDPQDEIFAADSSYNVIQLERIGKKIIMRAAHDNKPLVLIGTHEMANLSDEVLAGPFICSHNPDVIEEVRIWNIKIEQPVGDH